MQLNITTDYAVRMTLYLAQQGGVAAAAEIGRAMAIPSKYVKTVAKPLCDAGLLRAVRGVGGGFGLNLPPEKITMHAIVNVMEGTTRINRCLEQDGYCSRNGTQTCPVHQFYCQIQNELDRKFGAMTIARLLAQPAADTSSQKRNIEIEGGTCHEPQA